jgi:hypothetical protein
MWDQEAQESQTNINLQSPENSMPFARYNHHMKSNFNVFSTSQKTVNALPYPDQLDHFQTENEMSNTFPEHQYQETITVSFHSEVLYFYLD